MSAAGFGLLLAQGTFWIWNKIGAGGTATVKYVAASAALIFFAAVGTALFWLIGRKPQSVDFLIATEGEMKKVNWSSRREIMNSTGVVIFTMFVIAIFCFVCDRAFAWSFLQIGVLDNSVLDSE